MNDTPRSDQCFIENGLHCKCAELPMELCVTLERELAAVTVERDALQKAISDGTRLEYVVQSYEQQIASLKALNLQLVTDLHREMDRHDFQAACARVNATLENTPL